MVKWLFLPDHLTPPNPLFLLCKILCWENLCSVLGSSVVFIGMCSRERRCDVAVVIPDDFLLVLGASLQLQVFEEELQPSVQVLAGDNCELDGDDGQLSEQIRQLGLNTVPDFMMCRLAPPTAHLSISTCVPVQPLLYVQVLPGHDEGDHLQLHVLVCSHNHFHHRNHQVSRWSQAVPDRFCCLHHSIFLLPVAGLVFFVWGTWWPVSTSCWWAGTCC